jgi:hypothetical protein
MTDLLLEIHITENAINTLDRNATKEEKQKYYNFIFEKYGIDKEDFDKSVEWYSARPEKYEAIYLDLEHRIDSVNTNVEKYVYHPDLKPTAKDSVDTVNIWIKKPELLFVKNDRKNKVTQSDFDFRYDDYFLETGDCYMLCVKMRVYSPDTATMMIYYSIEHGDSLFDTVSCEVIADSVLRKYYLSINPTDTIKIKTIEGKLVDSIGKTEYISVDTVILEKRHNKFIKPLSLPKKQKLREIQDSAFYGKLKLKPVSKVKDKR